MHSTGWAWCKCCNMMQRFIVLCCLSAIVPWKALPDDLDARFPVRGLSIAAPPVAQVERFARFIRRDLAARRVNTLILRVDFNFAYDTHRAIDLIPKDVVICDWHYERAEPTPAYFALKGFNVVSCPWKNPSSAAQQVRDIVRLRDQSNRVVSARALGVVQTVWSGAHSFLNAYQRFVEDPDRDPTGKSEAACFMRTFASEP